MSDVVQAESQLRLSEMQEVVEERQKLKLREEKISLLEREAEAAKTRAEAFRTELDTLVAKSKLSGPSDEIRSQIAELQARLESAEKKARDAEVELKEERQRHEFLSQIDSLKQEISELRKVGRSQFDFWDGLVEKFVPILHTELRGIRENLSQAVNGGRLKPPIALNPVSPQEAEKMSMIMLAQQKSLTGEPLTAEEKAALQNLPQPVVVPVERVLVTCQSCKAQQWLDLARAKIEFGQYEPGKVLHKPCSQCGFLMNVTQLVLDSLTKKPIPGSPTQPTGVKVFTSPPQGMERCWKGHHSGSLKLLHGKCAEASNECQGCIYSASKVAPTITYE
jgi:hypothetical protein